MHLCVHWWWDGIWHTVTSLWFSWLVCSFVLSRFANWIVTKGIEYVKLHHNFTFSLPCIIISIITKNKIVFICVCELWKIREQKWRHVDHLIRWQIFSNRRFIHFQENTHHRKMNGFGRTLEKKKEGQFFASKIWFKSEEECGAQLRMVLKRGHCGKQIKNSLKVLKCGTE